MVSVSDKVPYGSEKIVASFSEELNESTAENLEMFIDGVKRENVKAEVSGNILSVDLHSLKTLDVPADIEWAMLVAYHRGRMEAARGTKFFQKYQDLDKGYDMVIGSIANDRMFYVLDSFFEGTITDTALVKSLSALKLGRQYVAITQKACDAVKIEREVQLLWMERQALKKASEQNRSNGIAFANQICKEYRREGRFFDEILDGAKQRR